MVSICVGHLELKILSEFKINYTVNGQSLIFCAKNMVDGRVDGWMVKPVLRIAYSNQKYLSSHLPVTKSRVWKVQ